MEKAFKNMLVFDQVRGEHSTGVAFVPKGTSAPTVVKVVGTPDNLFDTNSFTKAMAGSHRLILGHNRWATQGKVNRENAHPFTCGAITGVHNGSLKQYTTLDGHGKFDVDSHVLYNHISRHGLKDALANTYGAMALVWWDEERDMLNIFRNSERPLYYVGTKGGDGGFLASEDWMIWVAATRNSVDIDEIREIPIHKLIQLHLPANHYSTPLPKAVFTDMVSRELPVTTYVGNGYGGYVAPVTKPKESNVVTLDTPPQGVYGTSAFAMDRTEKLHGYEYVHFFEEVRGVDQSIGRDFILPAALNAAKRVKAGDTFKFNCRGFLRNPEDKSQKMWLIDTSTMEKVAENWEFSFREQNDQPPPSYEEESKSSDEDNDKVLDRHGKETTLHAWNKKYGTCDNCGGDVDYGSRFRYNTNDGAYCSDCIDDPVLADILPR